MNLQKINWKAFLLNNALSISTEVLFRIFNDWIPNSEEIFIDVVDYSHCHGGVKVILAGHYAHYYLDETGDELGLLYSRVKPLEMDNSEKIMTTLKSFLNRLRQFKEDPRIANKIQFDLQRLQFTVNDRGLIPNTDSSFKKIAPLLTTQLETFSGGAVQFKHLSDSRNLFKIDISFQNDILRSLSKSGT